MPPARNHSPSLRRFRVHLRLESRGHRRSDSSDSCRRCPTVRTWQEFTQTNTRPTGISHARGYERWRAARTPYVHTRDRRGQGTSESADRHQSRRVRAPRRRRGEPWNLSDSHGAGITPTESHSVWAGALPRGATCRVHPSADVRVVALGDKPGTAPFLHFPADPARSGLEGRTRAPPGLHSETISVKVSLWMQSWSV